MQSQAATVDAYLTEVPADRRPALERPRALCRGTLKGYTRPDKIDFALVRIVLSASCRSKAEFC